MTLLEIATRAVCQEIGLHPDKWENFAHLSQAAFNAIAVYLPEEIRDEFVSSDRGAALVGASTLTRHPDRADQV